jgi:hypothetical protein
MDEGRDHEAYFRSQVLRYACFAASFIPRNNAENARRFATASAV